MNNMIKSELKHFAYDGLQRSTRLELSYNHTMAQIWLIDMWRARHFCESLTNLVQDAIKVKQNLSLLYDWKVNIIHWADKDNESFNDCPQAVSLIGTNRIYRSKRSIVANRGWNNTISFVQPGNIHNYTDWHRHSAAPVEHMCYSVRSDIVNGLHQLFLKQQQQQQQDQHHHDDVLLVSPEEFVRNTNRSTDVSHFWPLHEDNGNSHLRHAVSVAIDRNLRNNYNIFVGVAGVKKMEGRNNVQDQYLMHLLDSKIFVVSQRDQWEDHYRLMEALVSGAMVMTDPMLSLPIGLKENISIVYYKSLDDLIIKIKYYLHNNEERQQIALEGYKVAMEQHRSNHFVEHIILG